MVNTEQIAAHFPNQSKVLTGLLRVSHKESVGIWRKGAIGDSLNEKLVVTFKKELRTCQNRHKARL
jgi:hypothetical protein